MKRIKDISNRVVNWNWDKIANIMVVVAVFIAILTFRNSNIQFNENLKHSELLYRKDSLLFQKQLELLNEPVVRIISDGHINGEKGIFIIKMKNFGISDIQNIEIFDDYYVAHKPKNGQTSLYRFGALFTIAQINIPLIKSGKDEEFTINFSELNKKMTDFYLSQKGYVMKVVRLSVSYERKVDGRKYEFKKIFIIGGHGDILIDYNIRDVPVLPEMISFEEVKNILGVK